VGAAAPERFRRPTAAIDPPAFVYHVRFLDELRASDAATELAAGEAEGRELGPFEAARLATETVATWKRSTARA
jgi:hypothetical protein